MKLEKRSDGWWIIQIPDTVTECGPYGTKPEAKDTMDGLQRTFEHLDDRKFWTTEKSVEKI